VLDASEDKLVMADQEGAQAVQGKTQVYMLSEDMNQKLQELLSEEQIVVPPPAVPDTNVTEVMIEDKSEEKENHRKLVLFWTGIGCLAVCGVGGVSEYVGFRMRLKKDF